MRAVVLTAPGRLGPVELPEASEPGPGEVLVDVRRVGVCGTDLHAYHGRQPFFAYPRILGHELGVDVLAVGPSVTGIGVGDRAAVRPGLACGTCDACRRGVDNACEAITVLGAHIDGGMRQRLIVPAASLHPSAVLSLDQLALVEPLSIGGHAVVRAGPRPDDRALIVGAGPIGLAVAAHLEAIGVRPLLVDLSPERLSFAARWAGVATMPAGPAVAGPLRDHLDGALPTLVFDATGSPASMRAAFDLVAHGGRLVFVGLVQGDITFHDPDFHRRELTLVASRNATAADFQRSIALMESGRADVGAWITDRVPLAEVPYALPRWAAPGSDTIKAIVEI